MPNQAGGASGYDIYLTATGWEYGDAMTFKYNIENCQYKISTVGTPAIIFNLTLVNSLYGNNPEQKVKSFKNVMSHELFHAVLSDYNESTLHWDNTALENNTLYLLFNEGMAHYISDKQKLLKNYHSDEQYKKKERSAFSMLSDSLTIALNKTEKKTKRVSAVKSGLYGKYWNKYICISGMFMAYHIENKRGEQELIKCVQNGPRSFIEKYLSLTTSDKNLLIPEPLERYINDTRN